MRVNDIKIRLYEAFFAERLRKEVYQAESISGLILELIMSEEEVPLILMKNNKYIIGYIVSDVANEKIKMDFAARIRFEGVIEEMDAVEIQFSAEIKNSSLEAKSEHCWFIHQLDRRNHFMIADVYIEI